MVQRGSRWYKTEVLTRRQAMGVCPELSIDACCGVENENT